MVDGLHLGRGGYTVVGQHWVTVTDKRFFDDNAFPRMMRPCPGTRYRGPYHMVTRGDWVTVKFSVGHR